MKKKRDNYNLRKSPTDIQRVLSEADDEFIQQINMIIIGECGVGKSCLVKRFCENEFLLKLESTTGVDFSVKKFELNKVNVRVNIWDLSGHQKFFEIRNEFYKYADIALLVFDVSNRKGFEKMSYWLNESKKFGFNFRNGKNMLILVGNKIDLENHRSVSKQRAGDFAKKYKLNYFETSAESGIGVLELFRDSISMYLKRIEDE